MIQLKQVCYAYERVVALRYVTLTIDRGERVSLMGPNGCGKTTLIKLLNGLIFPEEGTYLFDGEEITEKKMKKDVFSNQFHQRIGYVFQNPDVQLFCPTVEEEIAFGPRQMGLTPEEIKERVDDCLSMLQLEDLKARPPYQLSGGEKKRVSIACILSMNPEVLVFDEPLSGLDKAGKIWLTGFLRELKNMGKTLIISTHDEQLARDVTQRIIHMDNKHGII